MVGLDAVELLQPRLFQEHDEALVVIRIGAGAPVLLVRPALAHAGDIWLEDDAAGVGRAGFVHGDEDLAGQGESFASFGRRVQFLADSRALDGHRLGVGLNKKMDAEVALRLRDSGPLGPAVAGDGRSPRLHIRGQKPPVRPAHDSTSCHKTGLTGRCIADLPVGVMPAPAPSAKLDADLHARLCPFLAKGI